MTRDRQAVGGKARAVVFGPTPLLTVTIEECNGAPDIHLHAGGQGFWIARLMRELEVDVLLCGAFAGEVGHVVRTLVEHADVAVRAVPGEGSNGAYVHDRRSGERETVAEMAPSPLSRHEVDELYGATLVEALDADVCVLAGPGLFDGVVPPDMYRRMAADLRGNGKAVVADLSGEFLESAVAGGLSVLKVSHEDLLRDGVVADDRPATLVRAMETLAGAGAEAVVVTRAGDPALALAGGHVREVRPPRLETVDTKGAGDSLTAGIAAGIARGLGFEDALRLGTAAGALNVTRHGLATGTRDEILGLTDLVEIGDPDL